MQQFLDKPSIDFGAVRDGRRSMPLWMDIDLSTARSIAAGSALSINIAGNSFYVDADTTNVGLATLHFQDTNLGNASAPLLAAPGFVAMVAFTQILLENAAQAGKRLRIFYGVDIDFRAGVNASVISGSVALSGSSNGVYQQGFSYTGAYKSITALAANTPETVFTPAANANGAIIWDASFLSENATGFQAAYVAKNAAPANVIDGDIILAPSFGALMAGARDTGAKLIQPVRIAAGKGLYYISTAAETAGMPIRSVLYTLL